MIKLTTLLYSLLLTTVAFGQSIEVPDIVSIARPDVHIRASDLLLGDALLLHGDLLPTITDREAGIDFVPAGSPYFDAGLGQPNHQPALVFGTSTAKIEAASNAAFHTTTGALVIAGRNYEIDPSVSQWWANLSSTSAATFAFRKNSANEEYQALTRSDTTLYDASDTNDVAGTDVSVFVINVDGATVEIWQNGVLTHSHAMADDLDVDPGVFTIGNHPTSPSSPYLALHEVAYYGSALTDAQIKAVSARLGAAYRQTQLLSFSRVYQATTELSFTSAPTVTGCRRPWITWARGQRHKFFGVRTAGGFQGVGHATAEYDDPDNWTYDADLLIQQANLNAPSVYYDPEADDFTLVVDEFTTGNVLRFNFSDFAAPGSGTTILTGSAGNYYRYPSLNPDGDDLLLFVDRRINSPTDDEGDILLFVGDKADKMGVAPTVQNGGNPVISESSGLWDADDVGRPSNVVRVGGYSYLFVDGYNITMHTDTGSTRYPHAFGLYVSPDGRTNWYPWGPNPVGSWAPDNASRSYRVGDPFVDRFRPDAPCLISLTAHAGSDGDFAVWQVTPERLGLTADRFRRGDGVRRVLGVPAGATLAADMAALPTAAQNRDAILNRVLTGNHDTVDTVGKVLQDTGVSAANAASSAAEADANSLAAEAQAEAANDTIALVKVVTDKLDDTLEDDGGTFRLTSNALEQAPSGGGGLTQQQVRDAMALAPTPGTPAAGSVDEQLDNLQTTANAIDTATGPGFSPSPSQVWVMRRQEGRVGSVFPVTKQPGETVPVFADLKNVLGKGEGLGDIGTISVAEQGSAGVTIEAGSIEKSGTQIKCLVSGGTDGVDTKIQFTFESTESPGEPLQADGILQIRD